MCVFVPPETLRVNLTGERGPERTLCWGREGGREGRGGEGRGGEERGEGGGV